MLRMKRGRFRLLDGARETHTLITLRQESYWLVFVPPQFADQERMLAEVRQADQQVKSGHYVRNEDMKAWLLSWGTEHELPVPRCVCGKEHDNETLCQ